MIWIRAVSRTVRTRIRREETGPGDSTSSSLGWATRWDLETCGDSHICVTGMGEVSIGIWNLIGSSLFLSYYGEFMNMYIYISTCIKFSTSCNIHISGMTEVSIAICGISILGHFFCHIAESRICVYIFVRLFVFYFQLLLIWNLGFRHFSATLGLNGDFGLYSSFSVIWCHAPT